MADTAQPDPAELAGLTGDDARLRRRRWAQYRLQAYGITAIAVAGLALVTLLSTVIGQAFSAVTETYVTIDVPLPAEEFEGEDVGDANYNGLVKDALRETFPEVSGRSARRELYDLVSGGATFELRDMVIANPDLVGQTVPVRMLASDVTDLYLKGTYGELDARPHDGTLSILPAEDEDEVLVQSSAADFTAALEQVKALLLDRAAFLRRQAELQDRGVVVFSREAEETTDAEEREQLLAQAEARAAERDRLLAQADDLEARATAQGGQEELDEETPSVLVEAAGGWLKLVEIDANGGRAEPVIGVTPQEGIAPGEWRLYLQEQPEDERQVSDRQIVWIEYLEDEGKVETVFNWRFFSAGDSREPELAGIWGAAVGSFWTMLVTFALAFPVGVLAAIYLEEFAPKNRITDFIEVNINNLAAVPSFVFGLLGLAVFLGFFGVPRSSPLAGGMVLALMTLPTIIIASRAAIRAVPPSIVFGLLGLAVFLGFFGVPRSSPLAGGIVLALMTLPTIIIASRAAIRAVPPSIRDAALGLGASRLQTSFHHVLPLAMPGILTGTIIGMAQALGETAPLIMIGMVAFIVDIPTGITDSATVLPVQVFRWSDFPERAFEARTAAAICVLLLFLVLMNALAVFLRKRFERRW